MGTARTSALISFYLVLPLGSGLGYIIGAQVAEWAGGWQWALRVTPFLGLVLLLVMTIFAIEPERGAVEREAAARAAAAAGNTTAVPNALNTTAAAEAPGDAIPLVEKAAPVGGASSAAPVPPVAVAQSTRKLELWLSDLCLLAQTLNFVLVILGFTAVAFGASVGTYLSEPRL